MGNYLDLKLVHSNSKEVHSFHSPHSDTDTADAQLHQQIE
jgi:hypothetical protein